MRFAVNTKALPWRVRLAIFLGGWVVSGGFVHEGVLIVSIAVKNRHGEPIYFEEWRGPADQSLFSNPRWSPNANRFYAGVQ